MFKEKYLKYKSKYLKLKKQLGGGEDNLGSITTTDNINAIYNYFKNIRTDINKKINQCTEIQIDETRDDGEGNNLFMFVIDDNNKVEEYQITEEDYLAINKIISPFK
jgi:hypothetical protein